jgi:DNA-binding protein WhiA
MNAAPIMAGAPDAVSQPPAAERDHIVTENAAFARRVFNLLRGLYRVSPDITIRKNRRLKKHAAYIVCAGAQSGPAHSPDADIDKLRRLTRKTCCKKAALRGAFLAGGSVTDPEKLYHLEIFCKRPEAARFFAELMARFSLKPKITARGEYEIVYVKESESIVNFLNVTGAHRALMSLENIRIVKEMRNSVNRIVNCETANLEKTVNASLRQIANIMYIRRTIGFDALPPSLREIAELRVGNREIGLLELGQIANPPLGKSGVNHRLRKLDQIAEELRGANGRRAGPSLSQKNQTFSIRERP